MKTNLLIVRKTWIGALLLIPLATMASAQNYVTDPASAPSGISTGSALNSGISGTSIPPIGSGNPSPAPPNASLLAVPVMGTAPLTVDFYVGLANTPGSLFYAWNFGDGAESYLPAQPFMLHVYQNPGTYVCELELVNPQGMISTIAFPKITVNPHPG